VALLQRPHGPRRAVDALPMKSPTTRAVLSPASGGRRTVHRDLVGGCAGRSGRDLQAGTGRWFGSRLAWRVSAAGARSGACGPCHAHCGAECEFRGGCEVVLSNGPWIPARKPQEAQDGAACVTGRPCRSAPGPRQQRGRRGRRGDALSVPIACAIRMAAGCAHKGGPRDRPRRCGCCPADRRQYGFGGVWRLHGEARKRRGPLSEAERCSSRRSRARRRHHVGRTRERSLGQLPAVSSTSRWCHTSGAVGIQGQAPPGLGGLPCRLVALR